MSPASAPTGELATQVHAIAPVGRALLHFRHTHGYGAASYAVSAVAEEAHNRPRSVPNAWDALP
jgi:hypothetical protein